MNICEISKIMEKAEKIHFIGIGGISMSSLAMISAHNGYTVSGSDRTESAITRRLEQNGIEIKYFHDKSNIEGASLVVYTAAVKAGNPELDGAYEDNIPLCTRAEYLGWLMSGYRERIGVCGTHGKSTVTSMLSEIYMAAELDPTVVSGAELRELGGAYRIGNKENFIFEACEYCDSFLSFCPTTAVVTNIEYDHADYFKTMDQLRASFLKYANIGKRIVISNDDKESAEIYKDHKGEKITVALHSDADFKAENIEYNCGCGEFDIVKDGRVLCRVSLNVPGEHNISDAMLAAATALSLGCPAEAVKNGLEIFCGAKRRFEYMGKTQKGACVYNDYAHHPSELRAALSAAKRFGKRLICVFQPHTYSRTASLFDDFANSFDNAEVTLFADIYAARETNTYGVSSLGLANATKKGIYLGTFEKIADYIKENCNENDMIMILGAGDIIKLGELII